MQNRQALALSIKEKDNLQWSNKKIKNDFGEASRINHEEQNGDEHRFEEEGEPRRKVTFKEMILEGSLDEHMTDIEEEDDDLVSDDDQVEDEEDESCISMGMS